jgi:hypothetical protein
LIAFLIGGERDDTITDFGAANNSEVIDLSAVTSILEIADVVANHMFQSGGDEIIDDL